MSTWLIVWLVVGLVSAAALFACLIGLVRHVLVLGRSVRAFREEVQPIVDDLAREGTRASVTSSSIGRRGLGGSRARPRG